MKELRRILSKYGFKLLFFMLFIALWQVLVTIFSIKEFIIPSPIKVFSRLLVPEIAVKYNWPTNIQATFIEIILSFLVTGFSGIFIAIMVSWSEILRKIIYPIIVFFNSIPKIAMAPLFLLWFGYGILPNTLIAATIAFFPVIINTDNGLNAVGDDLLDLVKYLHASKWQLFIKIRIPNSLPYIFSGFKISATLCVVGSIVGEFIACDRGLGYIIRDAQGLMDMATMFASLFLISAMGLLFFFFISLLERFVIPWRKYDEGETIWKDQV